MWVIKGTKLRLHDQDYGIELKQQHPYDNSPLLLSLRLVWTPSYRQCRERDVGTSPF